MSALAVHLRFREHCGRLRIAMVGLLLFGGATLSLARPEFLDLARRTFRVKPGGQIDRASCSLCHAPSGPPAWNPFGSDVHAGMETRQTHDLTAEILKSLYSKDSDGDGYTNGEELTADTLPGDPKSHPSKHADATSPHANSVSDSSGPSEGPGLFSPAVILFARHAQHPLIVHFPIALFLASVGLDLIALWRKNARLAAAGATNLLLAAISAPAAVATGLLAWQLKFGGAALTGYLLYHLIGALATTAAIWTLFWLRRRRPPDGRYFMVAAAGVLAVSITGHLGGALSGVAF